MFNLLFGKRKKKYLDCPYLKNSLHLFYDEIRACCSNVKGPIFYSNINNDTNVDPDYIYKITSLVIQNVNIAYLLI